MDMTTTPLKPAAAPAAPMPDMDALPSGGGSYVRTPDGTLVPAQPDEPAKPE